ncbi:MAG: DUF512 domain-containing protein [Clostridia bacterium]|nr:DUF512 domain-containing protein [Clostridia bacterium]
MDKRAVISNVLYDSIAYEAGLECGDIINTVNGKTFCDILDFKYMTSDEFYTLEITKKDGTEEIIEIYNDYFENLGVEFENPLIDKPMLCKNKCVFCFMDQLPPNVRQTMLFKDDDVRLSFLQGNYVTLTNLNDEDINRLCSLKVSPINVSVHVTDSKKRVEMLKNPNAANLLAIMKRFADSGIIMNAQIVLCKGINDGKYLEKTIKDLRSLYPAVRSVSIVPVGLSKYRDNLTKLEGFDKVSSHSVIKLVEPYQKEFKKDIDTSLVYLADEFYISANVPIPSYEHYEEFPQIENGVGLIAAMRDEIETELEFMEIPKGNILPKTIATSYIAYDFICECVSKLKTKVPHLCVDVVKVKNNFFGDKITVTGLLCGSDIINQLQGNLKNKILLLSESMFKSDEDIFLDDTTLCDVETGLGVKVVKTPNTGYGFIKAILETEV